ncbi:HD-GYP domain-containing protein [Porticoccus sp. W117]|uniref:HD-GYP domain-containing protein n=1 Tax=Porticoccus sp. W117 TaxID=3054777 RepID=UPI002591A55C|nr:HD-GYP domain-containing protein [Porticoccus sp. W117]MDM3870216.1 HD-GYP domain-containing protein [Porticoccus sp. W117]
MRLTKVAVANLQPGMFVAELDRPWLETPFALQGFVVRDQDEVHYISQYVDYVYVDIDYSGTKVFLPFTSTAPKTPKQDPRLRIKADFQQAKLSFESASESLDRVFDSLSKGRHTDITVVKKAVNPLIDGVFRNKEAVAALVRLKEASDYRYNHGISMAVWGAILGRHLGLQRSELEKLVVGCAMCDVGMTKLSGDYLEKPDPLTDEQRNSLKEHPLIGSKMVAASGDADMEILAVIENHHERYDGSGYPRGVDGASIPLLARIAGLVDTYDAMITPRPYAPSRSSYEAVQELLDIKGSKFQESLVEQFVQAIGLFPTGSLVELNSGEVGIVVKQNETRRLKPEVVLVLDSNKVRRPQVELMDLAASGLVGGDARWIVRELQPGTFGVNSEEFFI